MADQFLLFHKAKVRGLGDVIDSDWFDIGKHITFFRLPEEFNRKGFAEALQTINPPYLLSDREPFKNYPEIYRQGKYQKRVRPEKRTVALSIFTATSELVHLLAQMSSHLYETDRVEVGRRLDHSRWVNFVEIASSTRWSEVEKRMRQLMEVQPLEESSALSKRILSLKPTDRIKDELVSMFNEYLHKIQVNHSNQTWLDLCEELLLDVNRQVHFNKAKEQVEAVLPCFHLFSFESAKRNPSAGCKDAELCYLERDVDTILAEERDQVVNPSVFIFSGNLDEKTCNLISDLALTHQCIVIPGNKGVDPVFPNDISVVHLTLHDLEK